MVGKTGTLAAMWAELRKHLDIDPPTKLDGTVYLGVKQHDVPPGMHMVVANRQLYLDLFQHQHVVDTQNKQRSGNAVVTATEQTTAETVMSSSPSPLMGVSSTLPFTRTSAYMSSAYVREMIGHAEQCVDNVCELIGSTPSQLKKVVTPCIDDHHFSPNAFEEKGV